VHKHLSPRIRGKKDSHTFEKTERRDINRPQKSKGETLLESLEDEKQGEGGDHLIDVLRGVKRNGKRRAEGPYWKKEKDATSLGGGDFY